MERIYLHGDDDLVVDIISIDDNHVHFEYEGKKYRVTNPEGNKYHLNGDDAVCMVSNEITTVNGKNVELEKWSLKREQDSQSAGGDMLSPMPGKILKLIAEVGIDLKAGDPIVVMEAMKMEHTIKASSDGKLVKYLVEEAQLVEGGKELFEFEMVES